MVRLLEYNTYKYILKGIVLPNIILGITYNHPSLLLYWEEMMVVVKKYILYYPKRSYITFIFLS